MNARMMPTFEPAAMRSIVLNRANKLAANSNFYIDGFEAHKMGNLVQAIFETIESQLQQAYEAGLRDAVPEGFTLVPNEPTMPMLIELNEIAIIVAGLGHEDGPQRVLTDGYKAMLAAAPKGD
mgnify:FL=1